MKAISIQQPFAHLIVAVGEKRVENRNQWNYPHRGPLLIHAAKSKRRLMPADERKYPDMAMGAIVGIAELVTVMSIERIRAVPLPPELAWLATHKHTEGPRCLVLRNVCRLAKPIPYRGYLGLFDVPDDLLAGANWIKTPIVG
jgi:hypothetical protein